jgi:hypothetical protein
MRYLVLLLVLPLQGCWFFMFPIPSSIFQEGNVCTADTVYVGQTIRNNDGRIGKVEKIIGRHQRCQSSSMPMLVDVNFTESK